MTTLPPHSSQAPTSPTPGRVGGVTLYFPPSAGSAIDLRLDANEGPGGRVDLAAIVAALGSEAGRRYPSAASLERALAEGLGVEPECVLVTAGGDEAIDRCCRAFLGPERDVIMPTPTFEMIGRYAALAGASVLTTSWREGPYPLDAVLGLVSERTGMIAVVSPNNPTGAVASARDLEQLSAAAPTAALLVDLAYTEFADEDLTPAALALPNAVVIRTFSKAFSLAGLRVGYAAGPAPLIRAMRAAGSPFPVSAPSLAAAEAALRNAASYLPPVISRVRSERDRLIDLLRELGARPRPAQGNFVLTDFLDAEWTWRALAGLGIGVRRFMNNPALDRSLRITCPGSERDFARLCAGLRAALRPEAILFDMDGVLADVSGSYRTAIAMTASSFGVRITPHDIAEAKARGDANNDWVLTHRLVSGRGGSATLDAVTKRFEALYHGRNGTPGLSARERLIPDIALLRGLADRVPLAIVTGRPRRDCDEFLTRFGLKSLFGAAVCMEDAPPKPDPAPVRLALERLGASAAWMIGDTPDDIVASRAAAVVPIAISPPGEPDPALVESLHRAGAARILNSLADLENILP